MNNDVITQFSSLLKEREDDIVLFRQLDLLDEGHFIKFAWERGIPVAKAIFTGEPGEFHKGGWLSADGNDYQDKLLFHPFRIESTKKSGVMTAG